jgi:hypothetical protein
MLHSIIQLNNHLCHEYMYGKYENHQNCKRSYLDQYGPFYSDTNGSTVCAKWASEWVIVVRHQVSNFSAI